jgi:hypothetical protein
MGSSVHERLALAAFLIAGAVSCRSAVDDGAWPDAGVHAAGRGGTAGLGGNLGAGGGTADSGGGGTGTGGASGMSGSGGLPDNCPPAYDLPSYAGDTSGLCPPDASTQCRCPGFPNSSMQHSISPECTPDGSACVNFESQCDQFVPGSWECGWLSEGACPELFAAAEAQAEAALPCASDDDCPEGRPCALRVANRMFCEGTFVARASELCPSGGAGGAAGASAQ